MGRSSHWVGLSLLAVLGVSSAQAATPPEGVPLRVRRGIFTDIGLGGFMTVGGDDKYSNFQSYVQLGVGYDVTDALEVAAHVGFGSNAGNCFSGRGPDGFCAQSDSFTATFFDATAAYLFRTAPRLFVAPKIAAGYTLLDPAPKLNSAGDPITGAANVGVGVGLEYATLLDHFSIGVDFMTRVVLGPNIVSLQLLPRLKYTF